MFAKARLQLQTRFIYHRKITGRSQLSHSIIHKDSESALKPRLFGATVRVSRDATPAAGKPRVQIFLPLPRGLFFALAVF